MMLLLLLFLFYIILLSDINYLNKNNDNEGKIGTDVSTNMYMSSSEYNLNYKTYVLNILYNTFKLV